MLELRSPTGARLPSWHPGAHIDLLLPGGLIRQYSLCGDPGDHGAYTIAVLRKDNGRGDPAGGRRRCAVLRVVPTRALL